MINFRTDMALERRDLYKKANNIENEVSGIETEEILKGIVENIKPQLLIVIDALASRSIERISSSIQIADTGIVPGAGVGNARKENFFKIDKFSIALSFLFLLKSS